MTALLVLAVCCALTWVWLLWAASKHDRLVAPLTTDDWSAYLPDEPVLPAFPEIALRMTEPIASSVSDTSPSRVAASPHRTASRSLGLVKARCTHLTRRLTSHRL